MSGAQTFSGKLKHLRNMLENLIVLGLASLGTVLATTMVPEETALQYELQKHSVADTSVVYLRLLNSTKRTFVVDVQSPVERPLSVSTSPPDSKLLSGKTSIWSGYLTPEHSLSVLLVVKGDLPESLADKLVKARLRAIDDNSGAVVEPRVKLREISALSISRSIRQVAWFMVPLLVSFALFFLWAYIRERRDKSHASKPNATSSS